MVKENDEVQHSNKNSCSSSNSNNNGVDSLTASVGVTSTSNATEIPTAMSYCETDAMVGDIARNGDKSKVTSAGGGDCAGTSSRSNHFGASTSSFMRSKLNDLVADLCINGPNAGSDNNGGYGDYKNGRSNNSGPADATMQQTNISSTWEPVSSSISSQHVPQPHVAPTQNSSSFSFKHFLSSGPPITAPSSTVTVTSLDTSASSSTNGPQNNNVRTASSSGATIQTSTGARPKVPQSASLSSTSISSLMTGGLSASNSVGQPDGDNSFGTSATKMKRSPRFSSFDSQASLAEFVTSGADQEIERVSSTGPSGVRSAGVGANANSGFRLYPESGDLFSTPSRSSRGMGDGGTGGAGIGNAMNSTSEYDRHQYVPRSYSNYEMPMSSSSASPRRRTGAPNVNASGGTREARPTRLALNTNSSKPKGNLPFGDISSGACGGAAVAAAPPVTRPLPSNAGEFPAAVLPDFVQDHWLDSWYAHDMHLNSPPNSPIRDFSDVDVAGGAIGGGGGGVGKSNVCDVAGGNGVSAGIGIPGPSPVYGGGGGATAESTASNAKMLPDFLSDGPIIHSSQRLADVAVGLPSNSIGSPDDPPISSQLSRLRIENDRLQRELNDARIALNEQTRRANDLECQLQANELQRQQQQNQQQHLIEELQSTERVEGLAERSKRTRTPAAAAGATSQNYVIKLKQQVAKLTSELETMRHENETLREEGAVGGLNLPYCDRSRPFVSDVSGGGASVGAAAGAAAGVRGTVHRPSRTQQFSRDLLRAASNAENNLRQLLAGVDNLRQMAADIGNSEIRVGYDVSPDLFSDFLDDCDDYEDYSDGPTL